MKKYSVRPARSSDIDAVHEIIANQNATDYGEALPTLSDFQKAWQNIDLGNDTCAAFADEKLARYAELRDNDSPFISIEKLFNQDHHAKKTIH